MKLNYSQLEALERVDCFNKEFDNTQSPRYEPTHRNIWSGCYDVWDSEQDMVEQCKIPHTRMKELHDLNLIFPENKQRGKYKYEVWHLTELGKSVLEKRDEI